ncbi:unnamed protein product [Rotaria sp. Silwood2]|nr:unnamed protein product [Rotaria sp. Silwood2]CAF3346693.1 unnamed protein product [Rotaria sp. Silwood2]CAF3428873.1 unnamed protein product [Rotaria sp. Silwood2]CAF4299522.1 unnamed protein product [Rotaria sp. Silwood2]CAF4362993.1 unnamed protein product [Rotaria sp. Silwood2]
MSLFLFILLYQTFLSQGTILNCDFETNCNDFALYAYWAITDGYHPQPIDHDHTLNIKVGHYVFYNPSSDKNVSTIDWTLIDVKLSNEKIKISIQTNLTQKHLAFDDISVDYCDGSLPSPPKLISNASDVCGIELFAPSTDYTFGNKSGHYTFVPVSKIVDIGKVGYLHLQKQLQVTSQESYCLNFQYYVYPSKGGSYLKIYSWASDESKAIQMLWPGERSSYYILGGRW